MPTSDTVTGAHRGARAGVVVEKIHEGQQSKLRIALWRSPALQVRCAHT